MKPQTQQPKEVLHTQETFEIKISGSGTREDIASSLRDIANKIHHPTSMGFGFNLCCDNEEWEDATLMAEINLQ